MMIGIIVFSMFVIGVVEWSRAAVPLSGGSSGSGGMVNSGGSATHHEWHNERLAEHRCRKEDGSD